MKLLVTRALTEGVMTALGHRFDTTFRADPAPLTPDEARAALAEYDAILPTLGDGFSADAFAGPVRTRILANFGVGYNHIDVAAAHAAGVQVTNTPGAVTDATADIALTLMLMSARRAAEGERMVRTGKWTGWQPTQMLGLHMTGKVLGIVGMGRIGKAIARRAHFGFDMRVVFHNRSQVTALDLPARQLGSIHEVMAMADIVVIAVPGGPETRHLIGADEIAQMRPHAHLINISRGDVIDESALIAALQGRHIAGAGLDVYEREPRVPPELIALENATLLPHLGTNAEEVRAAMGRMAYDNLVAFAEGGPLPNPVG